MTTAPVDAILIVSFGGPEHPDDVMPFLRNVTRGRNVPEERLAEVAEHYLQFGGKSPINDQARAIIAALQAELDQHGPKLPIYWGNRNWGPYLSDTVQQMADDGIKHAVAFVTSAYSSYSSCHQYREDLARAQAEVGEGAPALTKIRQFYNHPGFIEPMVRNVEAALAKLPLERQADAHLAFTAHSIPSSMAETSRYQSQLLEASRLVVERLSAPHNWELVYQSRSGPPSIPWLEPDIVDHLTSLHEKEVNDVVMVPIGFISDHMEVVFDLDTEAMEKAHELGMHVARADTVGVDPQFIRAIHDLINEVIDQDSIRQALGYDGPVGCQGPGPQCCPAPSRRPAVAS